MIAFYQSQEKRENHDLQSGDHTKSSGNDDPENFLRIEVLKRKPVPAKNGCST
jgi:hypothetical protein